MPESDIADLLSNLEGLCRQGRVMQMLLREQYGGPGWERDVRRHSKAPKVVQDVSKQFREVRASIESSGVNSAAIHQLTTVIGQFLLP